MEIRDRKDFSSDSLGVSTQKILSPISAIDSGLPLAVAINYPVDGLTPLDSKPKFHGHGTISRYFSFLEMIVSS